MSEQTKSFKTVLSKPCFIVVSMDEVDCDVYSHGVYFDPALAQQRKDEIDKALSERPVYVRRENPIKNMEWAENYGAWAKANPDLVSVYGCTIIESLLHVESAHVETVMSIDLESFARVEQ